MAMSLCDTQNCGRPRAGGQGQRNALVSNVSSLDCQQLWWWVRGEVLAPTMWEMKPDLLYLLRLLQVTG